MVVVNSIPVTNPEYMILVGDIGGTNARFGLVRESDGVYGNPQDIHTYSASRYEGIYDSICEYLTLHPDVKLKKASLAVATAVQNDEIKFTNSGWSFSLSQLFQQLNLESIKVINDFTGLALSIPKLNPDQLIQITQGSVVSDGSIAVLGPGTGLGVSGLLYTNEGWMPVEGEGGHVTLGATTTRELVLFQKIWDRYGHISAERILSGNGIVEVYQSLCVIDGVTPEFSLPAQVSSQAINGSCPICSEVMDLFFGWLGVVAGNLALTLGAQGGVFIGGGIVPRMLELFENSSFRDRYYQKGRFSDYLRSIPVYVISAEYPALTGAACALDEIYNHLGVSYQN